MPYPKDNLFFGLLGGDDSVGTPELIDTTTLVAASETMRKGVFSNYPAATPKYWNTNDDRSLETMARLVVPLSGDEARNRYLASFGDDGEARVLAESLASVGGTAVTGQRRYGLGYIDFLLTDAHESYEEKVQVVDVLSDNYVAYFFGQKPPIFQYSGVLYNTRQDDWRSAFTIIYNQITRGTQLARRQVMVTLSYDDMAVTGAMVNMNQTLSSQGTLQQTAAGFNFSLLVQRIDVMRTAHHPATELKTFPTYLKTSEFASQLVTIAPKTMRTISSPTSTVVARKKPEGETETDIFAPDANPDVHGAS